MTLYILLLLHLFRLAVLCFQMNRSVSYWSRQVSVYSVLGDLQVLKSTNEKMIHGLLSCRRFSWRTTSSKGTGLVVLRDDTTYWHLVRSNRPWGLIPRKIHCSIVPTISPPLSLPCMFSSSKRRQRKRKNTSSTMYGHVRLLQSSWSHAWRTVCSLLTVFQNSDGECYIMELFSLILRKWS